MDQQAKGEFDVVRTAEPSCDMGGGAIVGRNRFDKCFHGGLDANSVVQMLSVATGVSGSAAYVAFERVDGTLQGRGGSFMLQHSGSMTRGAPTLSLTVVPDSGTDLLTGLSGSMAIDIVGGKHYYTFDYMLDNEGNTAGEGQA